VKESTYYVFVLWQDLIDKRIAAPYVPRVKTAADPAQLTNMPKIKPFFGDQSVFSGF
jgi:hypothetical protein